MTAKKTKAALALALTFGMPLAANATGIPTVDIANIAQLILNAKDQAEQFEHSIHAAADRLNEMKSQGDYYKSMVDGHYPYENLLHDPELDRLLDQANWEDTYNDINISSLRDQFDMHSDDPQTQKAYDDQLKTYGLQEKLYNNAQSESDKMTQLYTQFEQAKTPAQKEDIANSISYQSLKMKNQQQIQARLDELTKKKQKMDLDKKERQEFDTLFGDGFTNPPVGS